MLYPCFLFLNFLLALRSQNQQMDGSWVRYEQLGIWCDFEIGFFASSRCFSWRWGNCPKFCRKWQCPHLAICRNQTAQHSKTGKYSYKRGIIVLHFGEKYASLPLPIFENHGRRIVGTEWTTTCYGVSCPLVVVYFCWQWYWTKKLDCFWNWYFGLVNNDDLDICFGIYF